MTIVCPDCGTVQELAPLPRGEVATCPRCQGVLERTTGRSVTAALALAVATFALLIPADTLPFLSYSKYGFAADSHLVSGVGVLFDQGQILLAVGIALIAVVLPLARFGLLAASLAAVRIGRRPAWLPVTFRYASALEPWAMADVFLLACFVGYNRISPYVPLHIHAGGYCFIVAAFLSLLTSAALDRRTVWRAIAPDAAPPPNEKVVSCDACDLVLPIRFDGARCPRCRDRVRARKTGAMSRTLALVIAGYLLYVPSNIFPLSTMVALGARHPHTIFWGIERLVGAGLLPLAILIFCTSIAFPLLKLVGLSWFLIAIRMRSRRHLVWRTKLHRFIDGIGRWSCMDPFAIAVFAPLIQFGPLASVHAGIGAPCFFSVVILSMLASRWFDPRLMWDAGDEAR